MYRSGFSCDDLSWAVQSYRPYLLRGKKVCFSVRFGKDGFCGVYVVSKPCYRESLELGDGADEVVSGFSRRGVFSSFMDKVEDGTVAEKIAYWDKRVKR